MICKNLKTGKYFNYSFACNINKVELNDGKDHKWLVSYEEWCKNYLIIDKWRNLSKWDIKYNEEIDKKIDDGEFSSS